MQYSLKNNVFPGFKFPNFGREFSMALLRDSVIFRSPIENYQAGW